jgi:hypothetical protein
VNRRRQGSQVNSSDGWDEVFLVSKAVALDIGEDDVNLHGNDPFFDVYY